MPTSNATPSINGWFFQISAGIYLFFKDIRNNVSLKIEGEKEDVEIQTLDGNNIYAQVKSIENVNVRSSVWEHYNKALHSLKSASGGNAKLIYFSNIKNPFNSQKNESYYDYGVELSFNDLTCDVQKKIKDKIGEDFDYSKLYVEIVHFYGTDHSKKALVKNMIESFLGKIGLSEAKSDVIYDKLIVEGLLNASNRKVNKKKSEIVYYIVIPFLTETISLSDFKKFMSDEYYDECVDYYEKYLYNEAMQYLTFTKITNDFRVYKKNTNGKSVSDFINEMYTKYLYLLDEKLNLNLREGVVKILLYKVIQKSHTISKIQEEANL